MIEWLELYILCACFDHCLPWYALALAVTYCLPVTR
jgi:hypothetical protein